MARGGMRIGEVLKLTPADIQDRKLVLKDPKSGKEQEIIFIPQKVADRLKAFVRENEFDDHERVFPICYEASRAMVKKAGELAGMTLPAASGRGIKTDKNQIILGGTRGFPPNPSSACLPHRKRMGYSKDHNKKCITMRCCEIEPARPFIDCV